MSANRNENASKALYEILISESYITEMLQHVQQYGSCNDFRMWESNRRKGRNWHFEVIKRVKCWK